VERRKGPGWYERRKMRKKEIIANVEVCVDIAKRVDSDKKVKYVVVDVVEEREETRVNGLLFFQYAKRIILGKGHCCYAVARYTKRMSPRWT